MNKIQKTCKENQWTPIRAINLLKHIPYKVTKLGKKENFENKTLERVIEGYGGDYPE